MGSNGEQFYSPYGAGVHGNDCPGSHYHSKINREKAGYYSEAIKRKPNNLEPNYFCLMLEIGLIVRNMLKNQYICL